MRTDDKVETGLNYGVDDNVNTRDQRRVGIWFLVVFVLAILGLISLGDSHAPHDAAHVTQEPQDMSGPGGQPVQGGSNAPDFDINRPVGVVDWPGMIGKKPRYLSGHGNSPAAEQPKQGVTPDTATDEASRKKAGSGPTGSDAMPTKGSPSQGNATQGNVVPTGNDANSKDAGGATTTH